MPGWNEASVDELLADPITRALKAADGVEPAQLRALLYRVQQTIERYAAQRGAPSSLARFAQLYSAMPRAEPAPARPSANRGRSDLQTNAAPGRSRRWITPFASRVCRQTGAV
jgi:hypothetical protein